MDKCYNVYLLSNNENNKTYVGITNNLQRRIRQHNSIICGGAKYTKCSKTWEYYGIISDVIKNEALSIEKKIKIQIKKKKEHLSKKD